MSPPRSVIHDLGYRAFTGSRLPERSILAELYRTSLAQSFGIGRSGASKIMPWLVVTLLSIPAIALAAVSIQVSRMPSGEMSAPSTYAAFPYWTQLIITIFVATQAPVLFTRDLRYRSIVLYFSRPIGRARFALTRWAALTTATFLVTATPMLVWFLCAVSTGVDSELHVRRFGAALVGVAVLSLVLAALGGLIATVVTRSGLALVAIIVALMAPSAMITFALALTAELGRDGLGQLIASLHPFTIVSLLLSGLFDIPPTNPLIPRPEGAAVVLVVLGCLAWVALPAVALVARVRAGGAR